jgi:uncharacterized protein (TIGR02145 family)
MFNKIGAVLIIITLIGLNGCVDNRAGTPSLTNKVTDTGEPSDEGTTPPPDKGSSPTDNGATGKDNPENPGDKDGDGVNDKDEGNLGSDPEDPCDPNPNADMCDLDKDGLTNGEESKLGTGKTSPDSDGDGIDDGSEVKNGWDPKDPCDPNPDAPTCDQDSDGLTNAKEGKIGTDPKDRDTDKDGYGDGKEIDDKTDPLNPCDPDKDAKMCDQDGDGLTNGKELDETKTDPKKPDTDDDGIDDGKEATQGTDPNDPCDPNKDSPTCDQDGDGITNTSEKKSGTDPKDPCDPNLEAPMCDQDGDGLTNGTENEKTKTDRKNPDTDGDGYRDGKEVEQNSDPLDPCDPDVDAPTCDQDGDGLTNAKEDDLGTVKTDPDTDDDGISDGDEVKGGSDPNNPCDPNLDAASCDQDDDGLTNAEEKSKTKTDPKNPDTDGDGVKDGEDYVGDDYTGLKPCLPIQAPGYNEYNNTNEIWLKANCDGDDYLNGTEDNISLTPSKISDPYDVNDSCFVYNSAPASSGAKNRVYCEVTAKDGRIWMDRNLGAKKVCENQTDDDCYGDYYQWGRSADGHETKDSESQDENPNKFPYKGSNRFEKATQGSNDWSVSDEAESRSTYVEERQDYWAGEDQNDDDFKLICPKGWHVPTQDELDKLVEEEGIINKSTAMDSTLKLPPAGRREASSSTLLLSSETGYIWTTEIDEDNENQSKAFTFDDHASWSSRYRAEAMSVRCIKDK